jgi:glycosyltransferase involved in cell wall biosynthesis
MKKILFAIPTLGGGGAERVLVNLVNSLDNSKYEITVFALFDGGVNKQYLNSNIRYKSFFKKLFRGNIHLLKLFSSNLLYKLLIKDEFDIAISYLEGPTTRIISGCPFTRTKLINWVHIEIHDKKMLLQSYRSYSELIRSYKKFNRTVFVSMTAKIAFDKSFPDINTNKEVIYNTVDYSKIISIANETISDLEIDNDKINLVSVGRYTHQKGYERLLMIIKELADQKKNVHLYLIGKGELEDEYIKIIKEQNLERYVTLVGYKTNPYKYVKSCDLFVCSSYSEGFSTAVTESLIVGTPVVTTLCSGMEELLGYNNEYGIITDNNSDALYEGIKSLVEDLDLLKKYREKATERGNQLCNENNAIKVEKLLDNLMGM